MTTPSRLRRPLFIAGLILLGVAILGAGGGTLRYYRITYGAPPLAVALTCFGIAAYLNGSNQRRRTSTALAMFCGLMAISVLAIWMRPSLVGALKPDESQIEREHVLLTLPSDRFRAELFTELQPVGLSNCQLERFGEPNDGGYLMCGNLLGSIEAGYSYGISGYDGWGCDVARKFNVPVHEYDCFDLKKPVCSNAVTVFHAECIGPQRRTDDARRVFDTLVNQFATNGHAAKRVVLKMDVEGAEWATLLEAPADLLQRIDQLVVEFHGIGVEQQVAVVRRLKEFFYVAHLHFNNFSCGDKFDPFPSWAYEVLFVNKRIGVLGGQPAERPHPLDAPNDPRFHDCQTATSRWGLAIPGFLRR